MHHFASGAPRLMATALLASAFLCAQAASPSDPGDYQRAAAAVAKRESNGPRPGHARNVILFIGDGMGIATITASRILEGQRRGESGEQNHLSFEDFPYSALVRTYSADQQVSDSAPTATAMMTGSHANDGALSVSPQTPENSADAGVVARYALPTLLEQAEERGLSTGVVSTARITHATPAAAYAHTPNRDWEAAVPVPAATITDIGAQLIARQKKGDGLEVVLGGGREYLIPASVADPEYPQNKGRRRDGRNLIEEWTRRARGTCWDCSNPRT